MNPKVKLFLVYLFKNAINASLIAATPIYQNWQTYNLKTLLGCEHVGYMLGGAILAREGIILIPKIYKWSQTNDIE